MASSHKHLGSGVRSAAVAAALCGTQASFAAACEPPKQVAEVSPQQVREFFAGKRWKVVTFFGYSGAGYENPAAMLEQANLTLQKFDPQHTIVNAGASEQGIGAVYKLAKSKGFRTAGVVSTQARDQAVALSPCVDYVFYVKDSSWGGYVPGTTTLSPTSEAIVTSSDVLVAIGGGDVARDELLAARRLGKQVTFIPADMNHRAALEKAASKGQPAPTDFRGSAHPALSGS